MMTRDGKRRTQWRNFTRGVGGPAMLVAVLLSPALCRAAEAKTFDLTAGETLQAVEMNHGDTLRFQLVNGQSRTFVLEETRAWIVEKVAGGIVYAFECRLRADGQPLTLRRFVCSQETFYEPWVVNGVRIWLSSSAAVFKLVPIRYPEDHYAFDTVDAVLAVQDATLPICPQPMRPWFPLERRLIDVGQCYNGDDPWLGPYLGQACHVGLDINMPKGTPLYAPIDFNDNWIFSADHRWRGVRRWPNGDVWGLQSHHVDRLLIDEGTAVQAGTHYAEAAGKGVGSHPHSHFEFRVGPEALNRGRLAGIELDPWILFWQIFEDDKRAKGELQAAIAPLAPTTTGEPVRFSASVTGEAGPLRYSWSFGDGGWSQESAPEYNFTRPGVFPVTLVIDDGERKVSQTQHVTVSGEALDRPALVLHAPDEVSFRRRPAFAADVYGWPVKDTPHTLRFTSLPSGPVTAAKHVRLKNAGGGDLSATEPPEVTYDDSQGWLQVSRQGPRNQQWLSVSAVPGDLPAGRYAAVVSVSCPGAVNARQGFRIELFVRPSPETAEVVVDDRDDAFFATPSTWVGHQFLRASRKGYQQRYLTNGGLSDAGAIARFTPDLAAGRYEVRFHSQTPFVESSFPVRIRHASGEKIVRFAPKESESLSLGEFDFSEGTEGYVEVLAGESKGAVVVDAVVFRRSSVTDARR